jgi:DNA-binding response OmpR family regulator
MSDIRPQAPPENGRSVHPTAQARILIVDDEVYNRQLLEIMLAPEGFLLEMADTGAAALEAIARHPPDLVLLDIMMPDMDGYEVTTQIKGNPATSRIPVILITSRDDQKARTRGLAAGAEEFLTKPVDRAELSLRVRNLLRLVAGAPGQNS